MIVLDTHIWIWWVNGDSQLSQTFKEIIQENEPKGLLISAITVWEVAKLVEKGRLRLDKSVDQWVFGALAYPGIHLI